jgi:hypothetical protein
MSGVPAEPDRAPPLDSSAHNLRSMSNSTRDRYAGRRLQLEYWQANMSKRRSGKGEDDAAEVTFPIPDGYVFDHASNLYANVSTGACMQRHAARCRR